MMQLTPGTGAFGASTDFGLTRSGTIKPQASASIVSSPLSIGFETLDRKMFQPEKTYPHLAKLGVKWARCQTGWARTETTKGSFDFTWLDQVVDSLRAVGVQPWFSLSYGNRLYTPGAETEYAVGWPAIFSDEARQAWVRVYAADRGALRYEGEALGNLERAQPPWLLASRPTQCRLCGPCEAHRTRNPEAGSGGGCDRRRVYAGR